jgi:hypothetical protein
MPAATDRILPPYTRRVDDGLTRLRRAAVLAVVALYAVFMGLALVVLPVSLAIIPFSPILALLAVVIWTLPEADVNVDGLLRKLFFWFLALQMVWPTYMALNLPGLPWISPGRIAMLSMVAVIAYGLGQSRALRAEFSERWSAAPWLKRMFWAFVVIQVITLPMAAANLGSALKTFVFAQMYNTLLACVAAYVIVMPGAALTLRRVMGVSAFFVAAVMIPEVRYEGPVWGPYIPEWLKGDPELVAKALAPQSRAADGLYRARSIFTIALYCAEYLGILMPFVLHNLVKANATWKRVAMIGVWLLMAVGMWYTNNRTAMVALIATHVLYGMWWSMRRRIVSRGTNDLVGPSVLMLYPAAAVAFLTIVLSSRTAYVRIIGGGQHQASNDSREGQYAAMWEKLKANPFGHGSGQGAQTVGWIGARDTLTLDSWVINLLMEFGVVGFLIYALMFFTAIIRAGRVYLRSQGRTKRSRCRFPSRCPPSCSRAWCSAGMATSTSPSRCSARAWASPGSRSSGLMPPRSHPAAADAENLHTSPDPRRLPSLSKAGLGLTVEMPAASRPPASRAPSGMTACPNSPAETRSSHRDGEEAAPTQPQRIAPFQRRDFTRLVDHLRYADHLRGRKLALEHSPDRVPALDRILRHLMVHGPRVVKLRLAGCIAPVEAGHPILNDLLGVIANPAVPFSGPAVPHRPARRARPC